MRIRPGAGDTWFSIPRRHDPDQDLEQWTHGQGEFSVNRAESFEKHLSKYPALNKYYAKLNGTQIKAVIHEEPLLFGTKGLEDLIYRRHTHHKAHAY